MEELIEKLDNLIKKLDKEESVKNIRSLNKKVLANKAIIELIDKYNKTKDISIKQELYNNKVFQEYKDNEMEVNLLIMQINSKLKEISNESSCGK